MNEGEKTYVFQKKKGHGERGNCFFRTENVCEITSRTGLSSKAHAKDELGIKEKGEGGSHTKAEVQGGESGPNLRIKEK